MNRNVIKYLFILLIALFSLGISGCEQEGKMEKAGKEIDKAAKDIGKATEEAMKDAGQAVEDAQQKVEEIVEDQKENKG